MEQYFYRIEGDDSRIWSTEEAGWLKPENLPPGAIVTPLYHGGLVYLLETLRFYGFPLGELGTKLDRIVAVQERYRPGLAERDAAWLSAQIDGDEETMAEIAGEKRELRAAMAAEIKAIQEEK